MSAVAQTADDVLIHVRFHPNAEVWTIDSCPEGVSATAWYERLLAGASTYYKTLANGRGFFRLPASLFSSLSAK